MVIFSPLAGIKRRLGINATSLQAEVAHLARNINAVGRQPIDLHIAAAVKSGIAAALFVRPLVVESIFV